MKKASRFLPTGLCFIPSLKGQRFSSFPRFQQHQYQTLVNRRHYYPEILGISSQPVCRLSHDYLHGTHIRTPGLQIHVMEILQTKVGPMKEGR